MRRWSLLLAGAALWLFLAAIPALADGGPHMAGDNSGVSSLTADGCAGCHRVHTAQGPLLLAATSEETLCLTCHGAQSAGATTDVMTGIQYASGAQHNVAAGAGTQLGALRNGGFDQARIGTPFRIALDNGGSPSRKGKVQVAATPANVTSAHLVMPENGLVQPGKAWGNGANGTGAGPVVSITCGSCHNPHGNGQFRILNRIPSADDTTGTFSAAWQVALVDYGVAASGTYRTAASHGLLVGDTVTVAGNSLPGANVTATVATVPANTTFTLTGVSGNLGTGGTVTRSSASTSAGGVTVTDAANPTKATRNYTVIQTQGPSYLLLLDDVTSGSYSATSGDYFHYQVPWNAVSGSTLDAPNGIPGTSTLSSNGFGQQITAWCTSCHTRYYAWSQPLTDPADGTVGAAYNTARPDDSTFTYQHRTRGASGRSCVTCHVSHGSNAVMDGLYSSAFPYPDTTTSASSRLLKVGNRGTCQLCHDPTGTIVIGDQYPPGPVPGTP